MPVIKADAYGHGAINVAKVLDKYAKAFAVALIEEAIALRQAGVTQDLVILEGAHTKDGFLACTEFNLIPVIHNHAQLSIYRTLDETQRPACWVKFDIGMHRLGFSRDDINDAWQFAQSLSPAPPVLCGHFSCADNIHASSMPVQLQTFKQHLTELGCQGSLANSPAILHWPDSHVSWNRAGIASYGLSASTLEERPDFLKPVMSVFAPIIAIRQISTGESVGYGDTWVAQRPSVIATVAIGYADGLPRHAPTGMPVYINGNIVPLVGRVSMDMITLDITDHPNAKLGQEVELWGENIAAEDVAKHCQTIAYEVVTRLGPRVPRHFIAPSV